MNKDKKVKWGILGCGKIANKFASDLALSQTGELIACASRNELLARSFGEKFNARLHFNNYLSLATCQDVDVIYIATPHSFHYEQTVLCLQNRKHVLCEKPMGINTVQVKSMIAIAQKHNVLLMEALWTAFLPVIREIQQIIKEGIIGEIRHVKADFGFNADHDPSGRLFNPDLAGGALLDIGIYPLFMSLLILGDPTEIFSFVHKVPTGVDDECTVSLKYSNGATASLYASLNCQTDTVCKIYGTKGKITIPTRFHEQDHFYLQLNDQPKTIIHSGKTGLGYYHEIEHMNECIQLRKLESPVMNFDLSVKLVSLMDKIRKQAGLLYPGEIPSDLV